MFGYGDAYIAVNGRMIVERDNDDKKRNKMLIFKNNGLFRSCISKVNKIFLDNAENLVIVMPMKNLLEYSDNYSITSVRFWNYYRDEINDSDIEINNDGNKINNDKKIASKSFEHKTKIIGITPNDNNTLNADFVVSLKCLSNFWRLLDLPLINCEIEPDLSWSKIA